MGSGDGAGQRLWTREKRFRTRSENGTLAIAETIVEILSAPRLVILQGELGAGKTTLVKGWVRALGAGEPDEVTSPTFTLVHEYKATQGRCIYHLDLYRLETDRELDALGLDEMLAEAGAVVLVEWGEKFARLMERAEGLVSITHGEGDERSFLVQWRD
jgi:tRNA threonylcarbamoyladenosine biosynthesis protein TsaE